MRKIWFWLVIIIILGLGLSLLFAKKARRELSEETILSETDGYLEIAGFSLTEYRFGEKRMEIRTERTSIEPKRIGFLKTPLVKEARMSRPQVLFFEGEKKLSHITADTGKMDMSSKRMLLRGGVVMTTFDGKSLSAKEMTVDPKSGLLSIKEEFTLKKNGDIINGKGLKSDLELKEVGI